ncbi:hypothetical protein HK097_003371, partial [Rhizophlyctis rosea]
MGILYATQATLYISHPSSKTHRKALQKSQTRSKKLQTSLTTLTDLLSLTHLEFRLSSPFPRHVYSEILQLLNTMSDRLSSMITMSKVGFGGAREEYILEVARWRKDMYKQVLLFMHVLATGLGSKTPLPAGMPPARVARLRLLAKLQEGPRG